MFRYAGAGRSRPRSVAPRGRSAESRSSIVILLVRLGVSGPVLV